MTGPTVHLNGTSGPELERGYFKAYDALGDAVRAVQEAAPNARDYYPQGPGAIERAMAEHRARLRSLEAVRAEIEAILFALTNREGQ